MVFLEGQDVYRIYFFLFWERDFSLFFVMRGGWGGILSSRGFDSLRGGIFFASSFSETRNFEVFRGEFLYREAFQFFFSFFMRVDFFVDKKTTNENGEIATVLVLSAVTFDAIGDNYPTINV